MYKRGQLSIFLMIAIFILIFSGIFFYAKNNYSNNVFDFNGFDDISFYVSNCLEKVGDNGVDILSQQGGFIYYYDNILNSEQPVAYHLINGKDVSVSKEFMESELNKYVQGNIVNCIDNFKLFQDYEISYSNLSVDSKINKKDVEFELNMPLEIQYKDSITKKNKFKVKLNDNLGEFINQKDSMLDKINENKIDLLYLSELDYSVMLFPYDKNNIVYVIYDENDFLSFAVKKLYSEEELQVDYIPDMEALANVPFNYVVGAYGGTLKFEDDTYLFDIDQNGRISFLPLSMDRGLHKIKLTVSNEEFSEEKIMRLKII